MLIGDLVIRSGLTKDTIRFYEKRGLILLKVNDRRANNYKEYPDELLQKLLLIKQLKSMGFTLAEIDTFLTLWAEEDASCKNIRFLLENKISQINNEIRKMIALKNRVSSSLTQCNNDQCEFEKDPPRLSA